MLLGTLALTRGNILTNAVGGQYVAMVIIALAYLNNRHTSRERYPVTLLFSALLAPLIKLLSYLYTNASVILSLYLFIGIPNMLSYENWHIKKLSMYRQLKQYGQWPSGFNNQHYLLSSNYKPQIILYITRRLIYKHLSPRC